MHEGLFSLFINVLDFKVWWTRDWWAEFEFLTSAEVGNDVKKAPNYESINIDRNIINIQNKF